MLKRSSRILVPLAGAALAMSIAACGGDSNDDEPARVDDLTIEQPAIFVADSTSMDVDFTFANDTVVDEDRNVIIKIRIGDGAGYVQDSAAVDRLSDDEDVDPESIERCDDGSTILTFDLDGNDLSNVDDPAGDADGTLKLDLVGTRAVGAINVEARAGYDVVVGSCDAGLVPQAVAVLAVSNRL